MAVAIPAIITAVGTAVGGSTLVYGAIALAASMAIGSYERRKESRRERDKFNAAQVDRLSNVVSTVQPRELVLGRVRKGGGVAFQGSGGLYNSRFLVHLALAAHEIDAIEQIYFDDQPVTLDEFGRVLTAPYSRQVLGSYPLPTGLMTSVIPAGETSVVLDYDPYAGSVTAYVIEVAGEVENRIECSVSGRTVSIASAQAKEVRVHYQTAETQYFASVSWDLGAPGSTADAVAEAIFPDLWTPDHRGEGIAKLIVEFHYNETAFPNGIPNVSAVIRGAKVYDPRTATTAWSQNPALLARHVYQHAYFGKATVSSDEDERFIAAANACDVVQDYVVNGVTDSQALFRADLVAQYGAEASGVLDDLTTAMGGAWAYTGVELFIRAGTYTAPVITLTDDDLAVVQRTGDSEQQDQISIAVHRERVHKINVVNLRIWDQEQGFKMVALTPVKATSYITRDGEELAQEVPLPAVSYSPQAQHIAGIMLRDARDALTVELPLNMRVYPVEIFDTVQVTLARYGWSAKTFMVLARTWDPSRGVIRLTMKETSAAIFQPDAEFLAQGYAENTAIPSPWDIDPPGTLSISSGTSELVVAADGTVVTRVRVFWPTIEDDRITSAGGQVEVQWANVANMVWQSVFVQGADTQVYLTGIADGMHILVRARTRTALAASDWGIQQPHLVTGKTEPPAAPTNISLTQELVFFRAPSDADLAGVRIRAIPGIQSDPVFSRGTDVIEGLVRISPARMERRLYGIQTVMVIAEDTSGNQSDPAFSVLDFGQPDVDTAIWTRVFAEEEFPGTYDACSLSGGVVVADESASSDVYALDNLYGEPDVYATQYEAMTWTTDVFAIPYTGVLTVETELEGNSPILEYRLSASSFEDLYASADVYDTADHYGGPGDWALWPGTVDVRRATPVEFRITIGASSERGTITTVTASLVMPEVSQTFSSITVAAAGTRLDPEDGSPPRNWVGALRAVYGWPAVDGSGAVAGRVLDFSSELGPLVQFVDNTGTPVTAIGTVKVEGYSDE